MAGHLPGPRLRARLAAALTSAVIGLAASACAEDEVSPYARLEGGPPPQKALGAYRGDGGRLVIRPASDPACEALLGAAVACYTHDEGLGPPEANATDPIDAGPVAVVRGEIPLQAAYTVDRPQESCAGLRGHHRLLPGPDGSELLLVSFFFRGRPVTEPGPAPCVPPEGWQRAR